MTEIKNKKELTVIIVTYNSEKIISDCLRDIILPEFEIIVVDNASSDDTTKIASKYQGIRVIRPSKNLGYGRAANIALKSVKTKYSILLNPDVKTCSDTIKQFLKNAQNYQETVAFSPRTTKNPSDDASKGFENVEWISGAVMLFNMKLLRKIGFFDENIFLFYEETDLCRRIIKAGYRLSRFNFITMKHISGASTANKYSVRYARYWHTGWSGFYFSKKHENRKNFLKTVLNTTENYAAQLSSAKNDPERTMQYTALLLGGTSFLLGIKAFDDNGDPTVKPD